VLPPHGAWVIEATLLGDRYTADLVKLDEAACASLRDLY